MTNTRRILAFMLAIFLVASVISPAAFAAGGPVRFVASDASGKPGETVTVHMAWLVPEEELDMLYVNLDPYGGAYEFDEHSLNVGYVDIRSK